MRDDDNMHGSDIPWIFNSSHGEREHSGCLPRHYEACKEVECAIVSFCTECEREHILEKIQGLCGRRYRLLSQLLIGAVNRTRQVGSQHAAINLCLGACTLYAYLGSILLMLR